MITNIGHEKWYTLSIIFLAMCMPLSLVSIVIIYFTTDQEAAYQFCNFFFNFRWGGSFFGFLWNLPILFVIRDCIFSFVSVYLFTEIRKITAWSKYQATSQICWDESKSKDAHLTVLRIILMLDVCTQWVPYIIVYWSRA